MYLGIDVGTSGVKSVLLGADGIIADQASSALEISRPFPLWSEQDPDAWWKAVEDSVAGLRADLRSRVAAIGLTGQMHGAVLLGQDDRPLRPAILWNDGRCEEECRLIERAEPRSRAITGNIAMPGFTAPKLVWIARNEPELMAKVRTILLPKDFVRLCMTGHKASDMSDSAGTLWLDVAARRWSPAMLDATGVDMSQMPELHEGSSATGRLRPEVAARWGMECVPVAAGGGDNAAGAAGMGVISDGDAMVSLGTSGVTFAVTEGFRPNPDQAVHAFCHCLPERWHLMAVHLSAASCLDWAAPLLGLAGPGDVPALAEQAGAGSGDELFLPFLSGERTPHNDPRLKAGFLGLDHATTRERLAAAVLEGVAFAHAEGLAALRDAGARIDRLTMIGGGSRSPLWGSIFASLFGLPIDYPDRAEVGPAFGAAKLGWLAETGASPEEICTKPPVRATAEPDARLQERLAEKFERYRAAVMAAGRA